MRKIIGLILLLAVFSCSNPPKDDSLLLKIKYQPETNYNYTSDQTYQTVIKYSGKAKSLQILQKRGIKNPTSINKTSSLKALIKTGKLYEDKSFPVKVEYVSTTSNGSEKGTPVKATLDGTCLKDSVPVFDIAVADGLDLKSRMKLLESWQKTFSQFSFSGEKLKVGEVLTTQKPVSIPMEGSEIEMLVTTEYKLISRKDGLANFEIMQHYTLNPKLLDNSFKGKVEGKGELVFDIVHAIVLNYTLKTDMQLIKKLDSFEFELKTISELRQTTKKVD